MNRERNSVSWPEVKDGHNGNLNRLNIFVGMDRLDVRLNVSTDTLACMDTDYETNSVEGSQKERLLGTNSRAEVQPFQCEIRYQSESNIKQPGSAIRVGESQQGTSATVSR